MKTIKLIALWSLVAFNGFATDYNTMTMTELQAMRGNISEAERAPYEAEMQSRVQAITTQEERQAFQANIQQSKGGLEDTTNSQTQPQPQARTQMQLQTQMQAQQRTRMTSAKTR